MPSFTTLIFVLLQSFLGLDNELLHHKYKINSQENAFITYINYVMEIVVYSDTKQTLMFSLCSSQKLIKHIVKSHTTF
jgi:hypothetical protein